LCAGVTSIVSLNVLTDIAGWCRAPTDKVGDALTAEQHALQSWVRRPRPPGVPWQIHSSCGATGPTPFLKSSSVLAIAVRYPG
jgi:hypothetical protein